MMKICNFQPTISWTQTNKWQMIKSMTGYGKAIAETPNKKITIEIKSLNSKQLDLNLKLPWLYKEKEQKTPFCFPADTVQTWAS